MAASAQVVPILARELCDGSWKDTSALLVMPGGADLPYCADLNGAGTEHILGAPAAENSKCHVSQCVLPN